MYRSGYGTKMSDAEKAKARRAQRKRRLERIAPCLAKSNGRCYYCGIVLAEGDAHIDHFEARANGGPDNLENYVASCKSCNMSKTNKPIEEFRFQQTKKKHGVPFFSAEQIEWLKSEGFDFHNVVISKGAVVFFFESEGI